MCGVSGFTGLGHLSAEIRYDLVEALGEGIDRRGKDASGAVVVTEEGEPRLIRKLGTWSAARGRFIRAASKGHSVMMHARYATMGTRDDVNNAHPFPIKRTDSDGKEFTVLYGCHNGMLQGTAESAKLNNRDHSVDSLEFFQLLADKAYETIRALSGYGVVTFIRPEDRKVRVIRLSKSSDFELVRLKGGGLVWGSTERIIKDALEYCKLEVDTALQVNQVGRLYLLSGDEVKETKVDGVEVGTKSAPSSSRSRVYTGSSYGNYGGWGENDLTGAYGSAEEEDKCHVCNNSWFHGNKCKYAGEVRPHQGKAYVKANPPTESIFSSGPKPVNPESRMSSGGLAWLECTDGTYRPTRNGTLVTGGEAYPIYVYNGLSYDLAYNLGQATMKHFDRVDVDGVLKAPTAIGHRQLTATEKATAKSEPISTVDMGEEVKDNGYYGMPTGMSHEEQEAWKDFFRANPDLAPDDLLDDSDVEEEGNDSTALTFANQLMKGDA